MNYIGKTFSKYISFVVRPNESKQLMNATYLCITYFFIVLFMFYVLYDTKLLQVRAKMCKVADYLNESFAFEYFSLL